MKFTIGSWTYRLRIATGDLTFEGRSVAGLCRETECEILLAGTMPARKRLNVLLHELTHAWIFATGQPESVTGNDGASGDGPEFVEILRHDVKCFTLIS